MGDRQMSFKRLWEENIIGALLVWLVFSVLARPGWLTVGGGVLICFLLYFTAPGIFWNFIALFNHNQKREDLLIRPFLISQLPPDHINLQSSRLGRKMAGSCSLFEARETG